MPADTANVGSWPTKTRPDAELLSREATAAIGSAINTLTETVKKHEPTLEDVAREALRPMLNSWALLPIPFGATRASWMLKFAAAAGS